MPLLGAGIEGQVRACTRRERHRRTILVLNLLSNDTEVFHVGLKLPELEKGLSLVLGEGADIRHDQLPRLDPGGRCRGEYLAPGKSNFGILVGCLELVCPVDYQELGTIGVVVCLCVLWVLEVPKEHGFALRHLEAVAVVGEEGTELSLKLLCPIVLPGRMIIDGELLGNRPGNVAGLYQDVPVNEVIERRVAVTICLHQVEIDQVQVERWVQSQGRVGTLGGRRG